MGSLARPPKSARFRPVVIPFEDAGRLLQLYFSVFHLFQCEIVSQVARPQTAPEQTLPFQFTIPDLSHPRLPYPQEPVSSKNDCLSP